MSQAYTNHHRRYSYPDVTYKPGKVPSPGALGLTERHPCSQRTPTLLGGQMCIHDLEQKQNCSQSQQIGWETKRTQSSEGSHTCTAKFRPLWYASPVLSGFCLHVARHRALTTAKEPLPQWKNSVEGQEVIHLPPIHSPTVPTSVHTFSKTMCICLRAFLRPPLSPWYFFNQ